MPKITYGTHEKGRIRIEVNYEDYKEWERILDATCLMGNRYGFKEHTTLADDGSYWKTLHFIIGLTEYRIAGPLMRSIPTLYEQAQDAAQSIEAANEEARFEKAWAEVNERQAELTRKEEALAQKLLEQNRVTAQPRRRRKATNGRRKTAAKKKVARRRR